MNIPWLGFVRKQEVLVRRLLVAGLAALAVVLGLTLSVGTAFAADSDSCTAARAALAAAQAKATPIPAEVQAAQRAVFRECRTGNGGGNGWPGNGFPGGVGGGHSYPGTWGGPRIDGRYLWLEQNLSLDVCSDSTYGGWYNRNLSHRDGILRLLGGNPNARWMQLHSASCGSGVSVSNDGQCITFRQEATRWGNDLNTVRRDWSGLRLRLLDVHHGWNGTDLNLLSLSERNDWNRLSGLDRDRFNSYNRVYGQLRTICNDPNPPVVIVQAPAPVTYTLPAPDAAPSGNDAASAPAPAAAAPLTSPVPSGAVQTGGDSPAWVLAHARAV